jgi:APA family basic amino acid/polyamine antiporter
MDNSKKIGFWPLVSIVISAQLGASVFLLPSVLAAFRGYGLLAWISAGLGAVLITVVFADLCTKTGVQGGPHVYADMFFGKKVGFFITWIYWWVAWACNPIMIATAINYLMSFTGLLSTGVQLILEVSLVLLLTAINTRGVKASGTFELIMTILKILPLVIVPIVAFDNINFDNFSESLPATSPSGLQALSAATLIAFWSFVGLEGGTSPAEFVKNPARTIPLAIIIGTGFVAFICLVNTVSIYGIIPPSTLETVGAPFAKIMMTLFGGAYEKTVGMLTFLMCAGSLNAWVLFSGQIAKSAASQKMFPKIFEKTNSREAPVYGLWISAFGTIILLFLQKIEGIGQRMDELVSISVIIYVVLYAVAVLAFVKFMIQSKKATMRQYVTTGLSLAFCIFLICNSGIASLWVLLGMLLTGVPVYLYYSKGD